MKAKLTLNGKEYPVEILDQTAKEIEADAHKDLVKVYERAQRGDPYYYVDYFGYVIDDMEEGARPDDLLYRNANYYLDRQAAVLDAKADSLMRSLRKFAFERNKGKTSWGNSTAKYCIFFDHVAKKLDVACVSYIQNFGQIYFETLEDAEAAIKEFETELLWYFKEYSNLKTS